ncbi:unnamed protein product [Arctogadus glacialis]
MKSPRAEDVRRGISALWDTLQCPICLELMTTPVSTKCDHQFCKFCMQKLLEGTKKREANCPVCKTKVTKRSLQESPGFQRLITGLQNMIEAYENDTRTNYFTGLTLQRRRPQSMTETEGSTFLSGNSPDNHHDNGDGEEHGLSGTHSSTVEANNGFASLMDLEDSNCLMVINDGLDTSFSETPQTSGEKGYIRVGISPTVEPVEKQEMAEVVEKATSRPRTRGKKRLAQLEYPPSCLALVADDVLQQQAPKDDAEKETGKTQKIQRQARKSVEKVSQWLLQVPLTENLGSGVHPDPTSDPKGPPTSPGGSVSSTSTKILRREKPEGDQKTEEQVGLRRAEPEADQKTEDQVKSLEDQVFGIVYTRRGKRSFSPPQQRLQLIPHDPSPVTEEYDPHADTGESRQPVPGDYETKSNSEAEDGGVEAAEVVVEIPPQMSNHQSSDTDNDVPKEPRALDLSRRSRLEAPQSEEPPPQEGEEKDEEGEASSLAFNRAVLKLERISANRTGHAMQDIDADLKIETAEKPETSPKRRPGLRKGKGVKRQNRMSARGTKPLVLVGALGGEAVPERPQSRMGCGEERVQIETYPSSEEVGATVGRTTRSRRPLLIAKEVPGSCAGKRPSKRAISTRGQTFIETGPDKDDLVDPPAKTKMIILDEGNQTGVNVTQKNGCICEDDIGGIENIGSVEGSVAPLSQTKVLTQMNGSIVEVPNTTSPCEARSPSIVQIDSTCRTPSVAVVPSSAPKSIMAANQNGACTEDSPCRIKCVEREEDEDMSDSEVDTEQLMKSFKVAKRKSFHLGSPKGTRSSLRSNKSTQISKTVDDSVPGIECIPDQIPKSTEKSATETSEKQPEMEKSSCGDMVASSYSPRRNTSLSGIRPRGLRRRLVQSEEALKSDNASLTKCQDSGVGCLSGNTASSTLSPNKAAKSLRCTVTPDASESVLLFSALEVTEDGSLGVTSRSKKRLQTANKPKQPTKRKLDAVTLPKTTPCNSTAMSATQGNTDNSVEVVNTNGSITPDGLEPQVVESSDKEPECSGLSAGSPIKKNPMRKAHRLESSSDEEIPTLAEIFKRRPPAVQCDGLEGPAEAQNGPQRGSECEEEPSVSTTPLANPAVCPPSPDFVEFSQASVDLFDTPAECDIAAIDNGVSMDSSQFSSDLLVTQQRQAMQKELLRLGNLMALVTEVLQEKEEGSGAELPADQPSTGTAVESELPADQPSTGTAVESELPADQPSTGEDLSRPCALEVKQAARDPAPIKTRHSISPHSPVANHVASPAPGLLRPDETAATVPQSAMATRPSTRLSGDTRTPSSQGSKVKWTENQTKPPPRLEDGATAAEDQVTRRVSETDPPDAPKPECVFVMSGLGSSEQVMVRKFAKRIGARVVPQVTPEVTHVIMCTDEDLVCERTLKYFLGIAGRKWVLSFLWISECFKQGDLLDEGVFEVRGDVVNGAAHHGPLRARSTGDQDLLMKGYKICFQGSFTDMTKDQMEWMVELCGAAVVKDPLQFNSKKSCHQLLIVQPGTETALTKPSASYGRATVVNRGWLLDSVATYTLQNPDDYRA